MTYPFGKAFTYVYHPLVDDEPVEPSGDAPAIYVYKHDNPPTRAVARAGDNAPLQTKVSWTKDGAYTYKISLDAIEDPAPNSTVTKYTYWIAINYKLATGGQSQLDLRALEMVRIRGHHKKIFTDEFSLVNLWPPVTSYASSESITRLIEAGKTRVQAILRAQGYKWDHVTRPDRLSLAITYWALAQINLGQSTGGAADPFERRFAEYNQTFESIMNTLEFEYDTDGDGEGETTSKPSRSVFVSR